MQGKEVFHYEKAAILLLAGRGSRFGSKQPKQYHPVKGIPLFLYAAKALLSSPDVDFVLFVVPVGEISHVAECLSSLRTTNRYGIIEGGASREESAFLAIERLKPFSPEAVLIHDANRPYLTDEMIGNAFAALQEHSAVAYALPLYDSLYRMGTAAYEKRDGLYLMQTPQAFRYETLLEAMEKTPDLSSFTDEASIVLKTLGESPFILLGDSKCMKVTTQSDITLLEAIL